jgi:hypothetical protein
MSDPDSAPQGSADRDGESAQPVEQPRVEVSRSFTLDGSVPNDVLPPETIARLKAGGRPTPAEIATIRSAALRDAGPLGRLLDAMVTSGLVTETGANEEGFAQTFEWRWDGAAADDPESSRAPATYYELVSGKPDPARGFFIGMRRMLRVIGWSLVLGVSIVLVALAVAAGESLETIVVVGAASLIVGTMIMYSLPRTPFD